VNLSLINIQYSQKEYAMANIAKTKTSKQLKTLLCDNSLHDRQVFDRGKDQIIYSCIYRYAAITLAEDMIPSPVQNGNYIDIDIGDHWWTNDVLIDYWEQKIKDRALKKKVKASLSKEDDENSPFSRIPVSIAPSNADLEVRAGPGNLHRAISGVSA
jgi:hypothetical protein